MSYVTIIDNRILPLRNDSDCMSVTEDSNSNDRHLIQSALAGDESAYEIIFEKYKRHVALKANRFFQNVTEVEEVVQISFTRAFTELEKFRGDHEFSFRSWLTQITINTCLNQLKTRSAKLEQITDLLSDHECEKLSELKTSSAEEISIQRDLIEKLLSGLTADDRVLLQMLHGEEMRVKEVAKIFGWSAANVRVRAFRARRSLDRIVRRLMER